MVSLHLTHLKRKPCQKLESGFNSDLNQIQTILVNICIHLTLSRGKKPLTSIFKAGNPAPKLYLDVTGDQYIYLAFR